MDYITSFIIQYIIDLTDIDPVTFVLSGIVATFILWILFVNVMYIKNVLLIKYPIGIKNATIKGIGTILLLVGFPYDIIFNITFGSVIFWELPHKDRLTLSSRLSYIIKTEPTSRRGKTAIWFCKYLIEPWDPNHCGLQDYLENKK